MALEGAFRMARYMCANLTGLPLYFSDSVCLACYIANGHIMTFGLPSLKPLLDVDYIPFPDIRLLQMHFVIMLVLMIAVISNI